MKIAFFLSTSGHSGVDRSINLLIPSLLSRGFSVDLVKVRKHGPYIESSNPNFRVIELATKHTMPALPGLIRYLKQNQPDVLLADKDRANRVALLAKLRAKVDTRVVVSSGTIMSINLKNRSWLEVFLHKLSMNYLYKHAHNIIVPSIDAADDLADISTIPRENISVVPLPIVNSSVDEKAAEKPNHPWLDESQKSTPVFIAVGELCPRKDQSTLIKAFAQVSKQQSCKLLLLGKGGMLEELKQLAVALGVDDKIDFLGFQNNPYAFIKHCHCLVHTATFEGFGMVLVEAMHLGVPVIATHCMGGPGEILCGGQFGRLVPVGNESALADAMLESLKNDNPSADDLRRSVEMYTVGKSTDKYLEAMGLPMYVKGS